MPRPPTVIGGYLAGFRVDPIGLPELFRQSRDIGDYGMDMALRVGLAARIVLEQSIGKITGPHRDILTVNLDTGFRQILFCPLHRIFDGLDMCL